MTVVLILLMCSALQAQDLPPALAELFKKGSESEKAGQLDAAEAAFRQVLAQGGNRAFVHNNLGIVYLGRGHYQRALAEFRQAVRLDETYVAPRVLMGRSLLALGRTQEAAAELERAVKIAPRESAVRIELALAYERSGDFSGMVDQFRELRVLLPQDPEYAYQLGRAYMRLSARCFQEISRVAPGSARVHQTIGENLMTQGRASDAINAYLKAVQVDPEMPGIHLALAHIYTELGKIAEARREIERELAIAPESAEAVALQRKLDGEHP